MKIVIAIVCLVTLSGCHPNIYEGKSLAVNNNSDERVYFWYSKNYNTSHFPDTLLPAEKPIYINSVPAHGIAGAGSTDPNWIKIYSELPAGKLSVYFFLSNPADQQAWEELISNPTAIKRKDVTLEVLKQNDYQINYP